MPSANTAQPELLGHFFQILGTPVRHCHEPTESCDGKAIRAHSIANSTVLSRMSVNGHVVTPRIRFHASRPPQIGLERVGKNSATTFSGLCARHDNQLFRPIDAGLPDIENKEHLFLLAYRATLREYHVVLEAATRVQAGYRTRIGLGLSSATEPDRAGFLATARLAIAFDCYGFKREFDRCYLESNWSYLRHNVVLFPNQKPSVAVNSLFSLDDVGAPDLPRVALNVFPRQNDVVAIFSTTPRDDPFVSTYLQRLLDSEPHLQKYLLSKLVLQHCDNFVVHPHYFASLNDERQSAICRFFADTIARNQCDHEDRRLFLF